MSLVLFYMPSFSPSFKIKLNIYEFRLFLYA